MASDTSDAEEFYDADEDVNLSPSPNVSPAKFVLPKCQGLENPAQEEAAVSEPRHDDSLQIIDSIIEESQKGGGVEEDLLNSEEKSSASSLPVAPDLPAAPDVEQEVRSHGTSDMQEAAPEGPRASQEVPPPDVTRALGPSQPAESDAPKTADILDQVPLGDKPESESDSSGPSKPPRQFTVEPDIVASTKKTPPTRPPPPSGPAPPRPPPPARPSLPAMSADGVEEPCGLVSPNSGTRGLAKELQHSLDLASATSGNKVVTAQESDEREPSPSGSETPGPQRPRSNSGRELTDEEILASVMIKNLDTGEEIPLNQAEEKLPAGINPLTLHIMRRTKEYITYD